MSASTTQLLISKQLRKCLVVVVVTAVGCSSEKLRQSAAGAPSVLQAKALIDRTCVERHLKCQLNPHPGRGPFSVFIVGRVSGSGRTTPIFLAFVKPGSDTSARVADSIQREAIRVLARECGSARWSCSSQGAEGRLGGFQIVQWNPWPVHNRSKSEQRAREDLAARASIMGP